MCSLLVLFQWRRPCGFDMDIVEIDEEMEELVLGRNARLAAEKNCKLWTLV